MRQETANIYKFAELSPDAKEKAREWYRGLIDSNDFDTVIEYAVQAGELLGIEFATRAVRLYGGGTRQEPKIFWSGFSSQGDGASFEGTYQYRKGALKELQAEYPAQGDRDGAVVERDSNVELHHIARALQQAQASHFYGLSTRVTKSGHYSHSGAMDFVHAYSNPRTGYTEDYYEGKAVEQIERALKGFANWIYKQLDNHNAYLNSDEAVDEAIEANEYEFYENGEHAK